MMTLRSSRVSGSRPILAATIGHHVEKVLTSCASPTVLTTLAPARRCPLFRMPRNSSCASENESISSIKSVGWCASIMRNTAAGEMFDAIRERGVSRSSNSSTVVFPHAFSGDRSARRGFTSKRSWAWARTSHKATASRASSDITTYRLIVMVTRSMSCCPSTGSAAGSKSVRFNPFAAAVDVFCLPLISRSRKLTGTPSRSASSLRNRPYSRGDSSANRSTAASSPFFTAASA